MNETANGILVACFWMAVIFIFVLLCDGPLARFLDGGGWEGYVKRRTERWVTKKRASVRQMLKEGFEPEQVAARTDVWISTVLAEQEIIKLEKRLRERKPK